MKTNLNSRLAMSALSALLGGSFICAGVVGCSSDVKKADIEANANPQDEINRLDQDLNAGFTAHYDVLDTEDFTKAQKELSEAKHEQENGGKQEKVLDRIATARGYLNKSKERSEGLRERAGGILEARTLALNAGARNLPRLSKDLKSADDEMRDVVPNLEKNKVSPQEWAQLQKNYQNLELGAIQETKLGHARAQVEGAATNGATHNTPKTLKQAQFDLQNAENIIATDRHNDQAMQPAIDKANFTAQMLTDVLAATKRPEGVVGEDVATALVNTARQNAALNAKLGQANSEMNAQNNQINQQSAQLRSQGAQLSLDQALESARKEFKEDEADVYRQGDKLLIRLKNMNFASGRSDLPAASMPVLAKVKTIAEELHPQQVMVEGHTDSTGTAGKNQELSQERAQAVASYFQSNGMEGGKVEAVGYGFKKPLTSNKTKAGRAQNRRVDVIITPASNEPAAKSM